MAYVACDTILDDEYNTFVTSTNPIGINHIMGTGATVYGLGTGGVTWCSGR